MLKRAMKPSHPGRILKNLYLEPLALSQGEAAVSLGITRKTLSLLVNEHQGISAEMALRLAKAFDTTPELWMNMQRNYDLWVAEQKLALGRIKVLRQAKTSFAEPLPPKRSKSADNRA
ncbi:MAG: HigA family addiction module antitoxin [Candidatus Pseudobacter hemicellulosilyticus]|uniref:HigA family addiction module antitoxin n=1 Tax=Candidatus Pseudobacter hemicellulosilyticus TaxID=3121375 RepID=A0AAJ6BKB5_9BACT|nr:MAG: HigA family addiction module antitoxin [Pseudobacter sp.]